MEIVKPIVSVLLPVRQWRQTTVLAVNSILAQTVESLELLIIGHADVHTLVKRLPDDPRIKPVIRARQGIVGALNSGLAAARGTYIARMDDDDVAYPNRLEAQLNHLDTERSVKLCGTRIRFIDEHGLSHGIKDGNRRYANWLNALTQPEEIYQACLTECPLPHPTLLAHRDVWKLLGGYREIDGPEDYDLILRAMLAGMDMGKPAPVLQDWREHPERLTHRDPRYRREAFTDCRANAVLQPSSQLKLDEGRCVWLCGTGRNARYWHDALTAKGVKVLGFVDIGNCSSARLKRDKPVISYAQLPGVRGDSLVITALTQPQARMKLQAYFEAQDWRYGIEYVIGG